MSRQNDFDKLLKQAKSGSDVARMFIDIESDMFSGAMSSSQLKISVRQFQRILKLSEKAYMGLSLALELGPECISISNEQIRKLGN